MRRSIISLLAVISFVGVVPGAHAATYIGTERADNMTGTAGVDTFVALGGDDTVNGVGDSDVIDAGPGFDFVSAWRASRVSLGSGDDIASVVQQQLDGGVPSRRMQLDCGPGEDFVFDDQAGWTDAGLMSNCEEVYAWRSGSSGYGRNGYVPRPDSFLMRGTDGADRLMGLPRAENIVGGAGNDLMFGNSKPSSTTGDLLLGGAGDDVLDTGNRRNPRGQGGPFVVDAVRGGSGNDIVLLRADNVDLDCGSGYDIVYVNGAPSNAPIPGRNCEEVAYMG